MLKQQNQMFDFDVFKEDEEEDYFFDKEALKETFGELIDF